MINNLCNCQKKLLEKYHFEKWGEMPRIVDFDGVEVGQLYYGLRLAEKL